MSGRATHGDMQSDMQGDVKSQPSSAAGRQVHGIDLTNAWEPPRADSRQPWTRRFGRPSGLAAGERVWLVIEQPRMRTVALNDTSLPVAAAEGVVWRREITPLLLVRNLLVIVPDGEDAVVAAPVGGRGRRPLPAGCGRVRLEIESAS